MSTAQTVIDRMRIRLDETTARKWSDAQLILYINDSCQWLARMFSRIPGCKRFTKRETFTNAASTETFDLTTLSKRFDTVLDLQVQISTVWKEVQRFDDNEEAALRNLSLGGGWIVPKYNIQDDNLILLPTFGTARTMAIRYRWMPALITAAGDTLETPDEYLTDIVTRALHFALADAGQANTKFEEEYAVRLNEIEDLERSRLGISNERVVSTSRVFSRCR